MVKLKLQLPEGFLEEEVRCDYVVSSKTKELWAVLLDLLVEFDRVCKKHDIVYFASGGTMLGAVRHKGFIPWDDDIDLMMFRDQYDKLCEIAPTEFQYPYFFQTEKTDFGHLKGHAKLRNSDTTGMLKWDANHHFSFNQGLFIDIFPLDSVVDDDDLFNQQKTEAIIYRESARRWASWTRQHYVPESNCLKNIIKLVFGRLFEYWIKKKVDRDFDKFESVCKRYNHLKTEKVSTLGFIFEEEKHVKYRGDYEQLVNMDFEFLTIPVGGGYEHGLTVRYGNYMDMIHAESDHGGIFLCDTSISYRDYLKQQKK